jgi:hypothetical protein
MTEAADGQLMPLALGVQPAILYGAVGVAVVVVLARIILAWAMDAS